MSETKLVRVYLEDYNALNDLILVEQVKQRKRLSFADIIHELLELRKKVEGEAKDVLSGVQRG